MKRIGLFMLPPLTIGGGAEKYFINLANNLSKSKENQVEIITLNQKSAQTFNNFLHLIYPKSPKNIKELKRESKKDIKKQLGHAKWSEGSFSKLGQKLKKFDVIYSKNEIVELITLKIIGYSKLPPIIIGVHTPIKFNNPITFIQKIHNLIYLGSIYKFLLPQKCLIHASNQFTFNFAQKNLRKESKLIPYPFSIKKFNQKIKQNHPPISFNHHKINIIFLGRLCDQKGQDLLLDLINKINKNKSVKQKINLNIFGTGDTNIENKLKQLSSKSDWIRYFGHIQNQFIPNILKEQDLLISPSKWEVLPFNIIEAQSAGVPVICNNIPGPADIIIHQKTGIILNKQEQFYPSVKNFILNKYHFNQQYIIDNIKNKFDPNKIYPQLKQMIINFSE